MLKFFLTIAAIIFFNSNLLLAEEKVTTAAKKQEQIAQTPASVMIVTREDIKKYGYMTLDEILENIPGMYALDDIGAYRNTFGVRGYWTASPRNIIFLVNGVSQIDSLFGFHITSNFNMPVEVIDRIEVIRGPMSIMYGPGAFFGAVNIITNGRNIDEKDTNLVSVSAGSKSTKKAAVKMTGTEGNINFAFNAGYSDTDGPNEPLNKMATNPYSFTGISKNNNDTTNGRLELNSKYMSLSASNKGYLKAAYDFNYGITLSMTGSYVDQMEAAWDITKNNNTGGRIGQRVSDYYVFGANLRFNDMLGYKGYYLNIRGNNIFNKDYLFATTNNITWADKGLIGSPMTFLATFGKEF